MPAEGVDPCPTQRVLGHGTVTLTLGTYSHVLEGMARQAAQAMDRA
jgi:hypothetical protein